LSNQTFELIEKYLRGELSASEKAMVEDKIKQDSSFAEEVEESAFVDQVIIGAGLEMLREKITKDIAQLDQKKKRRVKWSVAGLLVLIGCVAGYFFVKEANWEKRIPKNVPADEHFIENDNKNLNTANKGKAKKETNATMVKKKAFILKKEKLSAIEAKDSLKYVPLFDTVPMQKNQETLVRIPPVQAIEGKLDTIASLSQPTPFQNNCVLSFQATPQSTCRGEQNGSIQIAKQTLSGGQAPYTFSLGESGIKSGTGEFSNLAEGTYIVHVSDKTGCSSSQEVYVSSKSCQSKQAFSINPDYGEIWKIPYDKEKSGIFTILNRTGHTVFRASFGNEASSEWNGTDMRGVVVKTGLYICILQYRDGKKANLQITVVR